MPGWPRSCSPTLTATGCCKGVNVTATAALARALSIPVIASGGVGSIADIEALMAANEPNIEGVVVGRALYDGRIDPAEALASRQALAEQRSMSVDRRSLSARACSDGG